MSAIAVREAAPPELRNLRIWLCWRRKPKPGTTKFDKVPVYASGDNRSGKQGSPKDRGALVTLDEALAAQERLGLDGVGFALLEGNKIIALDLDHARDQHDKWKPLAAELLQVATYAEVSPSGTGVRMVFRGAPTSNEKNHDAEDGMGVELFATKGFVTFTGDRLNGTTIAELGDDLRTRLESLVSGKKRSAPAASEAPAPVSTGRNNFLTAIGGKLRYAGLAESVISNALMAVNLAECDPPLDHDEVKKIAHSVSNYKAEEWPKPLNIFAQISAPPLSAEDVPAVIGDYAVAFAKAAGFDPTATIASAVVASAACIDDGFRLCLSKSSRWYVSAVLWGGLLGLPASAKTPAQRPMLKPVWDMHFEWAKARGDATPVPGEKRIPVPALITTDTTIEALRNALIDNPRGLLLFQEEMEAWLGSQDAYRSGSGGGSKDRGLYLSSYDGGPQQINRVGSGPVYVPNWSVSLLTATTFAVLEKLDKHLPEDGLLQRMMLWHVRETTTRDESVDVHAAEDAYRARLRALIQQEASEDELAENVVSLSTGAHVAFIETETKLRLLQQAANSVGSRFGSHVAKHTGMFARVILVFHALSVERVSELAAVHVSESTVHLAARFMHKLFQHGMAIYTSVFSGSSHLDLAQAAAKSILASNLEDFNASELSHACRGFRGVEANKKWAALNVLVDYGWIRTSKASNVTSDYGARWRVNPQVAELFAAEAEQARARREAVVAAIRSHEGT